VALWGETVMVLWWLACLPEFPSSTLAEDPTHDFDGDGFVERPGDGTRGDCNDWDPLINPDAIEICDEIDNDCDGRIDDGDNNLQSEDWYADEDMDGFGDPEVVQKSTCDPGPGEWVRVADDCDDSDPDVYPGAEDKCEDAVDSDCDGILVCEFTAYAVLKGEAATNRLGSAVVLPGDLDGDGQPDLVVTAEGYDGASGDSLANSGAVYVVWGPIKEGTRSIVSGNLRLVGAQGSYAGVAMGNAGDIDGDGLPDLVIGAPATEVFRGVSPQIHLVIGPEGTDEVTLTTLPTWLGDHVYEALAGWSVDGAGDVDGDGLSDVIIGAPGDASQNGEVVVLLATVSQEGGLLSDAIVLTGTEAGDGVGDRVAGVGDVDGDGLGDFMAGAHRLGEQDGGAAWLILGADLPSGYASIDDVGRIFKGNEPGLRVGSGLRAGDFDGDGSIDLLIGASGMLDDSGSSTGGFFVVYSGTRQFVTGDLASVSDKLTGDEPAQALGIKVAVGDLNEDGRDDVLVRVRESQLVGDADSAVVMLGPFEGVVPVGSASWVLAGVQEDGTAGSSLGIGGDLLTTSGRVMVVGSSGWTDNENDQGAVFLSLYPENL
jgi:hypothetical protein